MQTNVRSGEAIEHHVTKSPLNLDHNDRFSLYLKRKKEWGCDGWFKGSGFPLAHYFGFNCRWQQLREKYRWYQKGWTLNTKPMGLAFLLSKLKKKRSHHFWISTKWTKKLWMSSEKKLSWNWANKWLLGMRYDTLVILNLAAKTSYYKFRKSSNEGAAKVGYKPRSSYLLKTSKPAASAS